MNWFAAAFKINLHRFCFFSFLTALPTSLCFWTEACILIGDGYTIWKWSVLGRFFFLCMFAGRNTAIALIWTPILLYKALLYQAMVQISWTCLPKYLTYLCKIISFVSPYEWTWYARALVVRFDRRSAENHHSMLLTPVLSSPGRFTGHEHQADGPDEKETGVHGSSPIKQICSWCLLVTGYVLIRICYRVIIENTPRLDLHM